MFTLTFLEPSGRRESIPLVDEERGLVVGREASCDFVVQSKEVSRRHARFFVRDGALVVEDLGSHNGVYFGEQRVEGPKAVPAGMTVELGDVKCTVAGSAGRPARAVAAERPGSGVGSGSDAEGPPPPGSARAGAAAARARAIAQTAAKGTGKPAVEKITRELPKLAPAAAGASPTTPQAGVQGVGAGAALRGMGKDAAQIKLPPRASVGRGADCDVVLDDDSVSRKHAELFRDDRGLYRIRDLKSANGTFVDGVRVEQDLLLPDGARLRFGDVELLFWKPPAVAATPASRQKTLVFALIGLITFFAALYLFKEKRRAEREAQAQDEAAEQTPEDEARSLAEQAQGALESDHFEEAIRLALAASEKDPLAQAPRRLLVQARREQSAAKTFAEAQSKAALGSEDEALRLFAQVDPQSRVFARARIKAKDLAQGLLRNHTRACQLSGSRERWESAAVDCALALDIKCQLQAVEGDLMLKALRKAERATGRKVPWSCPPQLAPLFHDTLPGAEADAAAAQKALKARYPDEKVQAAVAQYARGEIAGALRALSDPSVARSKAGPLAAEAAERIRLVDGRFREGQTALLRGDLTRVDDVWGEALKADGALLPPGSDSYYAAQMRGALSQAHAKAGDERFSKGQYLTAWDEWSRGLQASPRDPHLLDQLARLEKVAEGILAAGPSCDQLGTAAKITRADPPSPAHKAALAGLAKCK